MGLLNETITNTENKFFTESVSLQYEENICLLDENDFIALFEKLNAAPRWVTSAGKRAIQIIGHCHNGDNHSALFDPETLKVNCFSLCGKGMMLHTWVKQALNMDNPKDAKRFILEWIENQDVDLSDRVSRADIDFEYKEKPYKPEHFEPVSGIPKDIIDELYSKFDCKLETLKRTRWHTEDGIPTDILQEYDVACYAMNDVIILPHHNINGEIVGLYERSFKPLRRDVKTNYSDIPYKMLLKYPRAKYVPLLKEEKYFTKEKTSWSFPNSLNLYGLHKAKDAIKETGIVIIFEGAKSVMLAKSYGYNNAVATHTFGAHINHISMLIDCGAKEIVLAFDKEYTDKDGKSWELYEKKTRSLAAKVKDYVEVSRIIDIDDLIGYKDSPTDRGKEIFEKLYNNRENISTDIDKSEQQIKLDIKHLSETEKEELKLKLETELKELQAKIEEIEKYKYFRNKPIEWLLQDNTKITENIIDPATPLIEEIDNKDHLIKYDGQIYEREEFLYAMFPEYKKYKYKVKFNTDNIFYLGGTQRAKLQYHILARHFELVTINEQDKKDLEKFSGSHNGKTAQLWRSRMDWQYGHEKMISFGAALEVKGVIKGVWCYTPEITDTYAKYSGVKMSWEEWGAGIETAVKNNSFYNEMDGIKNNSIFYKVYISMYYQNYKYLTLPAEKSDKIIKWFMEYNRGKKLPFPFQGEIPNADMEFTIDFEKDISIVENKDLKDPAQMSEYNRQNNDKHNKDMGERRSRETFNRLVGDKWTAAEIRQQGFTDRQIRVWRDDYKWIKQIGKKGGMFIYQRV